MKTKLLTVSGLALFISLLLSPAEGATVSWVGGSGDWNTTNNWSTGALPNPGDDVVIGSGPAITITHSSGAHTVNSLQSQQAFVLSGGVLTVSSNFQSSLPVTLSGGTLSVDLVSAPALTLTGGSVLTCAASTASQMNLLDLEVSGSISVSSDSRIDVSGLGYLPGYTAGNTTVGGATVVSGGSYGGLGASFPGGSVANAVYGNYTTADDWGSGSGAYVGNGAAGGGRVRLVAGSLQLDGQLLADGAMSCSGNGAGSGSGGGVRVSVGTLQGSGSIQARGGDNVCGRGAGGGGRIAVYAGDWSGFNLTNINAAGGAPRGIGAGGAGTIYLRNTNDPLGTLVIDGSTGGNGVTPLGLAGTNLWTIAEPVIIRGSHAQVQPEHAGLVVLFEHTLTVANGASLQLNEVQFSGPEPFQLGSGSSVSVRGTLTSAAQVVVDGATLTAANIEVSSLLLTNSGLVTTFGPLYRLDLFVTNAITVSADSRIDVSGLGYLPGRTSGNTTIGGATVANGGSYGGLGNSIYGGGAPNSVYGDYANPDDWGSGAGPYVGNGNGSGGGLVRLTAGSLFLDGQLLADGSYPVNCGCCFAGGAGGGIYVSVGTLAGVGQIRAGGATSYSCSVAGPVGDGGGGRVAVYAQDYSAFNLADITAPGGSGPGAANGGGGGTVYIHGPTQTSLIVNSGGAAADCLSRAAHPLGLESLAGTG